MQRNESFAFTITYYHFILYIKHVLKLKIMTWHDLFVSHSACIFLTRYDFYRLHPFQARLMKISAFLNSGMLRITLGPDKFLGKRDML